MDIDVSSWSNRAHFVRNDAFFTVLTAKRFSQICIIPCCRNRQEWNSSKEINSYGRDDKTTAVLVSVHIQINFFNCRMEEIVCFPRVYGCFIVLQLSCKFIQFSVYVARVIVREQEGSSGQMNIIICIAEEKMRIQDAISVLQTNPSQSKPCALYSTDRLCPVKTMVSQKQCQSLGIAMGPWLWQLFLLHSKQI